MSAKPSAPLEVKTDNKALEDAVKALLPAEAAGLTLVLVQRTTTPPRLRLSGIATGMCGKCARQVWLSPGTPRDGHFYLCEECLGPKLLQQMLDEVVQMMDLKPKASA